MSRHIRIADANLAAKAERTTRANGRTCRICPKLNSFRWCPILGILRPPDAKLCPYGKRLVASLEVKKCKERKRR